MPTITRVRNQNARIVIGSAGVVLVSYTVPVVAIVGDRVLISSRYHKYSATTSRHIRNFTRDYGATPTVVEHSEVASVLGAMLDGRETLDPM